MSAEFDAAVARVSELSQDPGNDVKLKLYALYKQATSGDVSGKRPGFTNPVGRAKYDAWAACPACRPRMRRLSTSVWSIPVVRWDAAAYDGDFHFVTDYGTGLLDLLTVEPPASVIDIGCGTGCMLRLWPIADLTSLASMSTRT